MVHISLLKIIRRTYLLNFISKGLKMNTRMLETRGNVMHTVLIRI